MAPIKGLPGLASDVIVSSRVRHAPKPSKLYSSHRKSVFHSSSSSMNFTQSASNQVKKHTFFNSPEYGAESSSQETHKRGLRDIFTPKRGANGSWDNVKNMLVGSGFLGLIYAGVALLGAFAGGRRGALIRV